MQRISKLFHECRDKADNMDAVTLENSNQNGDLRLDKLSPVEFQTLQDLTAYSGNSVERVIEHFLEGGKYAHFCLHGTLGFMGFKVFLDTLLEVETPRELCRHLFRSFVVKDDVQPLAESEQAEGHVQEEVVDDEDEEHVHTYIAANAIGEESTSQIATTSFSTVSTANPSTSSQQRNYTPHQRTFISHHRINTIDCVMNDVVPPSSATARNLLQRITSVIRNPHELFHLRNIPDSRMKERRTNTDETESVDMELYSLRVPLKDMVCLLALIAEEKPERKLEFIFKMYDSDGNGFLNKNDTESIVNQMLTVAEYLSWDITDLRPILEEMMVELDYDANGTVSLDKWNKEGVASVPILVLLGLDKTFADDGQHSWIMKSFFQPTYCNYCSSLLVGFSKRGLCCNLCKYIAHGRCMSSAPACISTYVTNPDQPAFHHWIEGNQPGTCFACRKIIITFRGINGLHCRWCKMKLHNKCASKVPAECDMGEHRVHILPPNSIFPAESDSQASYDVNQPSTSRQADSRDAAAMKSVAGAVNLQICAQPGTTPLLVFVNQKSGGLQGKSIRQKLQYILNPRQVYDLAETNPVQVLNLFKDVPNLRVICCGGDGSIGWVLNAMDKVDFAVQPSLGIIPLGTGNDLARCLRWGNGYEKEPIPKILKKIEASTPVMLDRWELKIKEVPQNIVKQFEEQRRVARIMKKKGKARKGGEDRREERNSKETAIRIMRAIIDGAVGGCGISGAPAGDGAVGGVEGGAGAAGGGGFEEGAVGGAEGALGGVRFIDDADSGNEDEDEYRRKDESDEEEISQWPGPSPYGIINNYFSIGVDAAICMKFHNERERNPEKFTSRMKNKLWYIEFASSEQFAATCKNLHEDVEVACDGVSLNLAEGPALQGIVILNIPFTHGGSNLWGETPEKGKCFNRSKGRDYLDTARQDIGDGLIEVVGLENCLHMGKVRAGLTPSCWRLAQCSRVDILTKRRFPMQIDGEPWSQAPSMIEITHNNRVPMLMSPVSDGLSFLAMLRCVCCMSVPPEDNKNVNWVSDKY